MISQELLHYEAHGTEYKTFTFDHTGLSRKIYQLVQDEYLPNLVSNAFEFFSIKLFCIYHCSPKFSFIYLKFSTIYG